MAHNSHPLVTIAIPTYNRANSYLKYSLQSASKQTYQNIEIIVSDNCSKDNTEEVVRNVNDPRIIYFRQSTNIGPNRNQNFCLEQAKGDYYLQLHDDDMIDNDFVELCMKAVNYSTNIGIIQTGVRVIDSEGNVMDETRNRMKGESIEEFFRGWFSAKTSWYLCNTLFNTQKLKAIGGFPLSQTDDGIAITKLVKFGRVDVEDVKASFRKHSEEITFAVKVKEWCEDYLYLLDQMCELIPDKNKVAFRNDGMRFFSMLNYNRARAVKSPFKQIISYLIVYRKYHYFPSSWQLPPHIAKMIPLLYKFKRIYKFIH